MVGRAHRRDTCLRPARPGTQHVLVLRRSSAENHPRRVEAGSSPPVPAPQSEFSANGDDFVRAGGKNHSFHPEEAEMP